MTWKNQHSGRVLHTLQDKTNKQKSLLPASSIIGRKAQAQCCWEPLPSIKGNSKALGVPVPKTTKTLMAVFIVQFAWQDFYASGDAVQ